MAEIDKQVLELYQAIMARCQQERKAKTSTSIRKIAGELKKTENYLSSVENGREFFGFRAFLKYLLLCGFDTDPLRKLSIDPQKEEPSMSPDRRELVRKAYSLDEDQVSYLLKQADMAEDYRIKSKKK